MPSPLRLGIKTGWFTKGSQHAIQETALNSQVSAKFQGRVSGHTMMETTLDL